MFTHFTRLLAGLRVVLSDSQMYRFIIPGFVVTLFYSSFLWSMGWLGAEPESLSEDLSWTAKIIYWFQSSARWFSQMLFEFVVITLFSPIMAMLSERVETKMNGNQFQFSFGRFLNELLRTLGILITGFIFSTLVVFIWFIIAKIGSMESLTPYIVFIVKAFFIGFNYFDYSLERNGVPVGNSWQFALHNYLLMLLVGVLFSAIIALPFLGVMIAPFLTTIVATLLWLRVKNPI